MGQSAVIPLPERIPEPSSELFETMKGLGFIFPNKKDMISMVDINYTKYTMPNGWRFIDRSKQPDEPNYVFIDQNNMTRICVHGTWRNSYDCKLYIISIKQPRKFEFDNKDEDADGDTQIAKDM